MTVDLKTFVNATELVSFDLIKQACDELLEQPRNIFDLKAGIEDIEAILVVGHACGRLYSDIESVGSIDLFLMLHNIKNIFYTCCPTSHSDEALSIVMNDATKELINYCDKTSTEYSK